MLRSISYKLFPASLGRMDQPSVLTTWPTLHSLLARGYGTVSRLKSICRLASSQQPAANIFCFTEIFLFTLSKSRDIAFRDRHRRSKQLVRAVLLQMPSDHQSIITSASYPSEASEMNPQGPNHSPMEETSTQALRYAEVRGYQVQERIGRGGFST
jgi:hypothetical protein